MKPSKVHLGKMGEDLAAAFLQKRGYQILERNFRNRIGEMDIIARDKDTLCFIEVKTRSSEIMGSAWDAVSVFKQKKLTLMALNYLKYKNWDDCDVRFDVVAVNLKGEGQPQIELLTSAFEA